MPGQELSINFTIAAALAGGFAGTFATAAARMNALGSTAQNASARMQALKEKGRDLAVIWQKGAVSTQHYKRQLQLLGKQMTIIQKQQELAATQQAYMNKFQAAGAMRNRGMAGMMSAAVTAYAMSTPVRDAMQFEETMADINKVVDMSADEFSKMKSDILTMSTEIPMTADEIGKIVASAGQAGIGQGNKEELMEFARSAAQMGIAFDITAEEAGDMMAKWRTAFKMGQSDVVSLADKINYLGNNTAASASQISDVVTRIGPLGEIGGVASGEIAALGASMIATGTESEIAATGIKSLILGLTAGESATTRQSDAFAKLGLDAKEMAAYMQKDAKGAILKVMEALKGLSAEEQASTLKNLFGKESIQAIAPLLSNLDNLKKNLDSVGDSGDYTGSMLKEFETRAATAKNATELLENSAKAVSIAIGDALLPSMKAVVPPLISFAKGVADFASKHQGFITAVMGAGGALLTFAAGTAIARFAIGGIMQIFYGAKMVITGVKIAVLGAQYAFTGAKIAATGLSMAFNIMRNGAVLTTIATKVMTAAQWLWNAALSANPIGLVIIALAALAAGIYWCYRNFEKVQTFCAGMWESPIAAIVAFLAGPIGWLIYAAMGIIANWDAVKVWFTLLWDEPSAALEQFKAFVCSKMSIIYEYVSNKWESLRAILSHPIDAVVNFVKGGDAEAASATPDILANAAGGIYGKGAFLTTFAEESAEAAIPLDGSARAIRLWQQAGSMLGVYNNDKGVSMLPEFPTADNSVSGAVQVTYAPQITVQGNTDVVQMQAVMAQERRKFAEMMDDLMRERRRVSFA